MELDWIVPFLLLAGEVALKDRFCLGVGTGGCNHLHFGSVMVGSGRSQRNLTHCQVRLLCEPSQNGALPECLHWQRNALPSFSAVNALG